MRWFVVSCVAMLACRGGAARTPPAVPAPAPAPVVELRFLEPAGEGAWVELADAGRAASLRALADNEPARFALALYATAWELAPPAWPERPTLFIAVQPGGNYARTGLTFTDAAGERRELPALPYLILEESPGHFRGTLLHETGHVLHGLLVAGAEAGNDADAFTPIPHSTAAVTDRRTAFNEGFAIHLEAINAHCGRDPETRAFYDRSAVVHGEARALDAEYYWPVRDLRTYAQTFSRYQRVRDGDFAFEPAIASADYLRLQLDPARDRRTLRTANALVASEGFVASVVFHIVARGGCSSLDELVPRYRPVLAALRRAETEATALDGAPLVELVAALGAPAIDAFLDLSHGATIDPAAPALWQRLYDAALHLELDAFRAASTEAEAARARWRAAAAADPTALARTLGPVVVITVPDVRVGLALFGDLQPLAFDANAAGPSMLALIPGITADQVAALVADRARAPFTDAADFTRRAAAAGVPASLFSITHAAARLCPSEDPVVRNPRKEETMKKRNESRKLQLTRTTVLTLGDLKPVTGGTMSFLKVEYQPARR